MAATKDCKIKDIGLADFGRREIELAEREMILVGSGDKADKTWIEAGASGTETTGPWINDGALLRMQSQSTGEALGQVRAKARACR